MTPDEDFVIDLHPDDARIAVGSPCSGHGFKFASAIGKALAGLALDGRAGVRAIDEDRARFSIGRFRPRA
jgi:sarcosine oxidase